MDSAEVLREAMGRIHELVPRIVSGLDDEQLAWRAAGRGNSIGWLVWHQARIQDDHVAEVARLDQVWTRAGWYDRFGLDLPERDTGYGHDAEQVARVQVSADLLVGYDAAVGAQTAGFVAGLHATDLDRIVDERWAPPVTLGVRLVSVVSDCLQHLGQAAYARGLLGRAGS
jgi:hypothetical protein